MYESVTILYLQRMSLKNQMASILLAVAILNPVCCCLGDVLSSVLTDVESPYSCCDQGKTSGCPEDAPEQPCDCEQVSVHKEAWSDARLLPSVVLTSHSLDFSLYGMDHTSVVPNFVYETRVLRSLPSWKFHCVRLL